MTATHNTLERDGVSLHYLSEGEGPLIVFVHGFPGLSYTWRHQLPVVAAAGFRAVALDTRGYGRSSRPPEVASYDTHAQLDDLSALLADLGETRAVFVGHDFGAKTCWSMAAHRPEQVRGVVSVAVPYGVGFAGGSGGGGKKKKPSEIYAAVAKKHFFHMHYFQALGPADEELARDPRDFLRRIYWALSADGRLLDWKNFPSEGTGYLDVLEEPRRALPYGGLTEADLDALVREFTHHGREGAFSGGLASYRVADHNDEVDPDYGRAPVETPALFICGEKDPVLQILTPKSLETMGDRVTDLRGTHLIPGAGHFVQQEQPEAFNEALLPFLRALQV